MHILFIPSWYPETAESFAGTFFREQAEAFVQEGHHAGVLALKTVPVYQFRKHLSSPLRRPRGADENGVQVLRASRISPVPKLHRLNNALAIRDIERMYRAYVDEHGEPDVLHAHSMFDGGIWAAVLSRSAGIPFVLTEHRPSSIRRTRIPGWRAPAMRAAAEATALVAVAKGFVPELNEAYEEAAAGRWRYVPGLLSPQFEDVEIRHGAQEDFVFGHVSHLAPGKRVDLLLRAFACLLRDGAEARLRIVGGSAALPELRQLAVDLGVEERVIFTGPVSREDILYEFQQMDAFVLPSVAEAFGTVLWEAMACGLPVISTRTWAGENAVEEGVTGYTTAIDSESELAEAMSRMLGARSTFDAERIRRMCLAHCGHDEFIRQYLELYRG